MRPTTLAAAVLSAGLLLAGCEETPEEQAAREARDAERALISEAEWRLERSARDPDSVETREVRVGDGTFAGQKVVCGEVNGRNGFGGMTGFQRFIMVGGVVPMTDSPVGGEHEVFEQAWREAGC